MPGQGRLGDKANVPADAHGCPACPHPGVGPAISGSPNVNVNSRPALRVGDTGIHAVCCGPNMWTAKKGSATVFINGQAAHRIGDMNQHCGGVGQLIEGSQNVIVGDGAGMGVPMGGGGGSGGDVQAGASGSAGGGTASDSGTEGKGGGPETHTPPPAPPQETAQAQDTPEKLTADWRLVYDDDQPVKGFKTRYTPPAGGKEQELQPDGGGHHQVPGLNRGDTYSVTFVGTESVRGKIQGPTGKAVPKARLRIERALGDAVEVVTDAGGNFEVKGLVEKEPFEVVLLGVEGQAVVRGKLQDEKGRPVGGARLRIERAFGEALEVVSDAGGNFEARGLLEGEDIAITVLSNPQEK